MGGLVLIIGAGVGLIAEATSSKQLPTALRDPPKTLALVPMEKEASSSQDEITWDLEEASFMQPCSKKQYNLGAQPTVKSLVHIVASRSPPPPYAISPLSDPVIIPQRRPGTLRRGFVRAYAPVLSQHGIDQATFLSFIKNFDLAAQASPLLNVVYVSASAVGFMPQGWAILASSVVTIAARTAMEAQQRSRGNSYMDQMNEQLFKPRGLYAMIMTYIPDTQMSDDQKGAIGTRTMDVNGIISGDVKPSRGLLGKKLSKGTTMGAMELPQATPLVFPNLDTTAQARLASEGKLKKSKRFLSERNDRRSQARYLYRNPECRLNLPADQQPQFRSGLADPNHPAFQGSVLTLLSGGRVGGHRKEWEARRNSQNSAETSSARNLDNEEHEQDDVRAAEQLQAAKEDAPCQDKKRSRKAKSNILYLMVVPLPSDQEVRSAKKEFEIAEKAQRKTGKLQRLRRTS